ncbi:MAG: MiaB/RimO family radical SAM methylthiotransferase [bacterium]
MKAYFVSLGCPKNLTDTEVLMGKLAASGYEITTNPAEADTIVVNTCAFLKTARDEALKTIKEMANWKKKGKCKQLLIAGCLPKYLDHLSPSGRGAWGEGVDGTIDSIGLFNYCTPRIKATSPWYAYVKIAEGCDNRCSYCLIPSIRGKLQVREVDDIISEVKGLAARGVKEMIFIAQDTTAHPNLPEILERSAKIKGIAWIRLMYAHPTHLSDKVLEVMANEDKIVKYLDLPIQHSSDKILRSMNRPHFSGERLENLIHNIRRKIPQIALRTTVIVGFPGENEADFRELLDFIGRVRFERLGAFAYQKEKGTPASKLREQVSGPIKVKRVKQLMRLGARLSRELGEKMIGQTLAVLIEGSQAGGYYVGRSYMDAPGIDGNVLVRSNKSLSPGEIIKARITKARTYDLIGSLT